MSGFAEARAEFLLALQFLTRLPVPDPGYTPERMAGSTRWHPAAGALIGALVGAAYVIAALAFPPLLALIAATGFGLLLTGAFHEDGFADACDGLGGGATRERAMEIMRDSRLGTYGTAGLGLMLAAKIAALAALPFLFWVLIAGHAASRASAVAVIAGSTYLRDHGTGKPVAEGLDGAGLGLALLTAAAALLPLAFLLPPMAVIAGLGGLAAGHWLMRRAFERKLGGYTGDCLGAVQQTSELGFYAGLVLWL